MLIGNSFAALRFILVFAPLLFHCLADDHQQQHEPAPADPAHLELLDLLFPNRVYDPVNHFRNSSAIERRSLRSTHSRTKSDPRQLATTSVPTMKPSPASANDALCATCTGMQYCSILNKLLIQEVYYPSINNQLGTCSIIDQLGQRMDNELFGIGRTFRDTPQCRNIVLQYLCLFWGSDNSMYTNLCIFKEEISSPDQGEHRYAPRPPCRSFCVQIAEVCANKADFMQLCEYIACPPTEDECNPDPIVGGEVVDAGLLCNIPSLPNPYSGSNTVDPLNSMYVLILLALINYFLM